MRNHRNISIIMLSDCAGVSGIGWLLFISHWASVAAFVLEFRLTTGKSSRFETVNFKKSGLHSIKQSRLPLSVPIMLRSLKLPNGF
jgi:hypothetical protein